MALRVGLVSADLFALEGVVPTLRAQVQEERAVPRIIIALLERQQQPLAHPRHSGQIKEENSKLIALNVSLAIFVLRA